MSSNINKNPLTPTAIVFAIGDAYTIWEAIVTRDVPVFTVIAWVLSFIFFFLYVKRSPVAATYLFYSILPVHPLYFSLKVVGLITPASTTTEYVIMFVIYAVAVVLTWRLKRNYDRYVAENQSTTTVQQP